MLTVHARLRRTALATAVALLAPASVAAAGTPFTIGTADNGGGNYGIAIHKGTGTAYVVYKAAAPTDIVFCKLPRGATTCSATTTLSLDTDPSPSFVEGPEQPWILRNATTGALTILDSRYVGGDIVRWSSTDDGATWSSAVQVSDAAPGTDSRRPVLMEEGFAAVPSLNTQMKVNRVKLDGTTALGDTQKILPDGGNNDLDYDTMTSPATGVELVATAASLNATYSWILPTGQNADSGAWSAGPTLVANGETEPVLINGGGTTYLFTRTSLGRSVRTWNGSGFGAPTAINLSGVTPRGDVSGDGKTVLVTSTPSGVRAAVSLDGASYGTRLVGPDESSAGYPDVAIANDGQGFAIWKSTGNVLKAADLTDVAPVPTPTPTPVATPVPTPTPTPRPGGTTFLPGGPTGVPSTGSGSSNGGTYTVTGPKTCVPRGGKFSVTLKVKKQKKKGNLFVKVTKVDFSIDGKVKKTDKKAPFKQTLTATATAAKGSTITMRARAYIKVRKTKKVPKKSVFLKIRVCS